MNTAIYFGISLVQSVSNDRVAASLEVPDFLYEKYDYGWQKSCESRCIATRIDQRPTDLLSKVVIELICGIQFNVQTLKSPEKRKYDANVFRGRKFGSACFQETRAGKCQIRGVENIAMCSNAASTGDFHACEVWINSGIPWYSTDSEHIKFTRDDVSIAYSDPRV